MRHYDHRRHAGNSGDVWKHLLLLETLDDLLVRDGGLVYAESHVGRPEYPLRTPGDWMGGIGKCWPLLPRLKKFCYFKSLASFNPSGLERYPGSASLVLHAAGRCGAKLQTQVWDNDPEVAAAWRERPEVSFHLGDGFLGVGSLLDRSPPGLMLIDPPYIDQADGRRAEKLFCRARELGWTVLWWHTAENEIIPPGSCERFEMEFSRSGLDGGGWKGVVVTVAGADGGMSRRLHESAEEFVDIMA